MAHIIYLHDAIGENAATDGRTKGQVWLYTVCLLFFY